MPNGNKNNGNNDIELLPTELRRPEEKKRKEEKPEVKLFVPEEEKKPKKPIFVGKFFGPKQKEKPPGVSKTAGEADVSVFKMQREILKTSPEVPSAPPAAGVPLPPPPKIVQPKPEVLPKPVGSFQPKTEPRRAQNGASKSTQPTKPNGPKSAGLKLGVTLMPKEKVSKEEARWPKQKIALIVIAILLAVTLGVSYAVMKQYQSQADLELQKVESDLGDMDQKIKNLDAEKNQAQIFQRQLKAADKLLEEHIYWTNFFSFLEKNTVAGVYFVNMVGGSDGQIVLSGVAKSYKDIARQIVSFRTDDSVSRVSILSASASVDSEGNVAEVDFDAKLKLKPGIFLKLSE